MNSKFKKTMGAGVALVLMAACFFPAIAGAFPAGDPMKDKVDGRKGHRRPVLGFWRNVQLIQKLELTDEQVKQVREADFSFREKHLAVRFQLDGLRLQMDKAFSADTVDRAVVRQLAEKIADIQGQLFVLDVESRLALAEMLNKDQIDKLKAHQMRPSRHDRKQGAKKVPEKPGEQKIPIDE